MEVLSPRPLEPIGPVALGTEPDPLHSHPDNRSGLQAPSYTVIPLETNHRSSNRTEQPRRKQMMVQGSLPCEVQTSPQPQVIFKISLYGQDGGGGVCEGAVNRAWPSVFQTPPLPGRSMVWSGGWGTL